MSLPSNEPGTPESQDGPSRVESTRRGVPISLQNLNSGKHAKGRATKLLRELACGQRGHSAALSATLSAW